MVPMTNSRVRELQSKLETLAPDYKYKKTKST